MTVPRGFLIEQRTPLQGRDQLVTALAAVVARAQAWANRAIVLDAGDESFEWHTLLPDARATIEAAHCGGLPETIVARARAVSESLRCPWCMTCKRLAGYYYHDRIDKCAPVRALELPIFKECWPRTPMRDRLLKDLATPMWKLALYALYLETGRFVTEEAKRSSRSGSGATFGWCLPDGRFCPQHIATHVGWTLE